MTKIDLITGFLGSGKTTFMKKYASYLMAQGENICILENDYGAVNVDMMLLNDLQGDQCELEMVAGGCDYDCHKRRFKTKLIAMGMYGYDRVLVEPSGIFDVDEFFDVLYEEPLDRWYEIGNVIAVVDAHLEERMSETSDYLLASQIANAGAVVLSKTQLVSDEEINKTISHIHHALEQVKCSRKLQDEIITENWETFTDSDFAKIASCDYVKEDYVKQPAVEENAYDSLYFMNRQISVERLEQQVRELFADETYGHVFRVKGFVRDSQGDWLEINAAKDRITFAKIKVGQEVIIVIGENLCEDKITEWMG